MNRCHVGEKYDWEMREEKPSMNSNQESEMIIKKLRNMSRWVVSHLED